MTASPITIVDCQLGNIMSVQNMLRRLGFESTVTSNPERIAAASKLILPGVGAFGYAMNQLRKLGLEAPLQKRVAEDGVPVLGICLGMQILCRGSEEDDVKGLGWLPADVVAFDSERIEGHQRIPHMGWGEIEVPRPTRLFPATSEDTRFYFTHAYHLSNDDEQDVVAWTTHGYAFPAAIERGNIVGVQFHPEKSHRHGMEVLRNFAEKY